MFLACGGKNHSKPLKFHHLKTDHFHLTPVEAIKKNKDGFPQNFLAMYRYIHPYASIPSASGFGVDSWCA